MYGFAVGDKVRRKKEAQGVSWVQLMTALGKSPDVVFTVSEILSDTIFQLDSGWHFYTKLFELVTPKRQKKYI